jgi:hypothetical protein
MHKARRYFLGVLSLLAVGAQDRRRDWLAGAVGNDLPRQAAPAVPADRRENLAGAGMSSDAAADAVAVFRLHAEKPAAGPVAQVRYSALIFT